VSVRDAETPRCDVKLSETEGTNENGQCGDKQPGPVSAFKVQLHLTCHVVDSFVFVFFSFFLALRPKALHALSDQIVAASNFNAQMMIMMLYEHITVKMYFSFTDRFFL
jgi:hypothetical protein